MIYSQVMQDQSKVYIKVDGYVSNSDIKGFIRDYKNQIKGIKTNKFNLVIEPNMFEDLYYVAEISAYDCTGYNPATLKLIKNVD